MSTVCKNVFRFYRSATNYGIGFPVAGLMIKNHKTEIKQKQECQQNALVAVLENIKQLF